VFIQDGIQLWEKLELYLANALWTYQSLPKAATGFAHHLFMALTLLFFAEILPLYQYMMYIFCQSYGNIKHQ
jgi:hypothetical protein